MANGRNLPASERDEAVLNGFSGVQWTIALIALWAILSALAEFQSTADFAVAMTFAIAIGATGALGLEALAELNTLVSG